MHWTWPVFKPAWGRSCLQSSRTVSQPGRCFVFLVIPVFSNGFLGILVCTHSSRKSWSSSFKQPQGTHRKLYSTRLFLPFSVRYLYRRKWLIMMMKISLATVFFFCLFVFFEAVNSRAKQRSTWMQRSSVWVHLLPGGFGALWILQSSCWWSRETDFTHGAAFSNHHPPSSTTCHLPIWI